MSNGPVIVAEEIVPVPRRRAGWASTQAPPPPPPPPVFTPTRPPALPPAPPDPTEVVFGPIGTRRAWVAWVSPQQPVTPPGPVLGGQAVYPVVAQVPDTAKDVGRLRRATQQLAAVFNTLAGKGFLRETGVSSWTLLPGGFYQNHAPGPNDDVTAGAYPFHVWIDTSTGIVYMNIDNTQGAAVWKQISV